MGGSSLCCVYAFVLSQGQAWGVIPCGYGPVRHVSELALPSVSQWRLYVEVHSFSYSFLPSSCLKNSSVADTATAPVEHEVRRATSTFRAVEPRAAFWALGGGGVTSPEACERGAHLFLGWPEKQLG